MPAPRWQWTEKLPLFVAGLIAIAISAVLYCWGKSPMATGGALLLILIAASLFVWSAQVAAWCTLPNKAFGQMQWSSGLWHEPSFSDCLRLTGVAR